MLGDLALESSEKLVYHFEGILMENDNQKNSFLKNAHNRLILPARVTIYSLALTETGWQCGTGPLKKVRWSRRIKLPPKLPLTQSTIMTRPLFLESNY